MVRLLLPLLISPATDFLLLFGIEGKLIRGIRSIPDDQLAVDEFWA